MGDRRKRVKPETMLGHRIALPPIQEQLRLAAQIDRMAVLVDEARGLLQRARDEALRVCRALLYGRGRAVPPLVQVGELARQRPTDVDVSPDEEYHFAGVYSFGRGVFPGGKKKGAEFAYKELTRLRRGDFTYPKLMAWEGALGIVPTECDGLVVSPEFPVFELDKDRVLPDVLDVYFRTP